MAHEMLKTHLASLVNGFLAEERLTSFSNLELKLEEPGTSIINAYISMVSWKITLGFNSDLYEIVDDSIKREGIDIGRDEAIRRITYSVFKHELGHYRYCPSSKEGLELILGGSYDIVGKRIYGASEIKSKCFWIQNLFSDTVLNAANSMYGQHREDYRSGLDLFFLLHGGYFKQQGFKGYWDKALELHIGLNHLLCGTDPQMRKKTGKYMSHLFFSYDRILQQLVDLFAGDETLGRRITSYHATDGELVGVAERMNDMSLWKELSGGYAEIMTRFASKQPNWMDSPFTRKQGGEEDGEKGQGSDEGGSGGEEDSRNDDDGKGSARRGTGTPTPAEDFFRRIFGDQRQTGRGEISSLDFDFLDRLYSGRAQAMILNGEEQDIKIPEYRHYMGAERIDPGEFSGKRISWSSSRIRRGREGERELELYRRHIPLSFRLEAGERSEGIPDLGFILDQSASEEFDPIKGTGEYHLAALAFYSSLEGLRQMGIAPLINYLGVGFSNRGSTASSGWKSYSEIDDVKRVLLAYQGGGTYLDAGVIGGLAKERRRNCVIFMLSDTLFEDTHNEDCILEELGQTRKEGGVGFYLFQLGGMTRFSGEILKMGYPVLYVRDASDFLNKSIILSKDIYGGAI